jgi:hypothetical protein
LPVSKYKLLKKKVKEHCVHQAQFCLPTIVLFCPGASKPWLLLNYQWTMLTDKASMVHLQCFFLLETCSKNAEAAENCHIFQFVFFNVLSHTLELHLQRTKLLQSRPEPILRVCAISAFSLHYFGSSVDWQNFVEIKGFP